MLKNIHIIINPAAGQDAPILSQINKVFDKSGIEWNVSVTKKAGDARSFAREAATTGVDAVAIYGGDGSVVEVAEALFEKKIPLAIIPGGTANVLAKELKIPIETEKALTILRDGDFDVKQVDMGRCNGKLFILRINSGFVADMVVDTDPNLKEKIGQLAYGVTAVKALSDSKPINYSLVIDDKEIQAEGVALVITNCGNIGYTGISYVPDINISDGLLDVIIIKRADVASVVALAGSALLQQKADTVIDQWKGKKVSVVIPADQTVMCDDVKVDFNTITCEILPSVLSVLVPKNEAK